MRKPLSLSFPDQLRGSAPKPLSSAAVSLGKTCNSIFNSGPKNVPKFVEIGRIKIRFQAGASLAEAGVKKKNKSVLEMRMLLLSVTVLGLIRLLPRSIFPLRVIITRCALARTGTFPDRTQKLLTSMVQMQSE